MSYPPERIYALDIETDNSPGHNGLDPAQSSITEIAVATDPSIAGGGRVFQGPEADVIDEVDAFLTSLEPGLITTWNGTFFDFPFIADRLTPSGASLGNGLRMTSAPSLRPKYDALPGHATPDNPGGGYQVSWHLGSRGQHSHLDVAQSYRRFADEHGIKWSLKPVCAALGIDMVEIDRERLHDYTAEERSAYNLSDGHGTRELALRLLGLDYTPYRESQPKKPTGLRVVDGSCPPMWQI